MGGGRELSVRFQARGLDFVQLGMQGRDGRGGPGGWHATLEATSFLPSASSRPRSKSYALFLYDKQGKEHLFEEMVLCDNKLHFPVPLTGK